MTDIEQAKAMIQASPPDLATNSRTALLGQPNFQAALRSVIDNHKRRAELEQAVISAMNRNPDLWACDPASILIATLDAARCGLLPTGKRGGGWLIPRREKGILVAQFQTSYYGELMMVRACVDVDRVVTEIVHDQDQFSYAPSNLGAPIVHEVANPWADRGEARGVYSIIRTAGGGMYWAVMSRADVLKRRKFASPRSPLWNDWEEEAWKKTALRKAANLAPMRAPLPFDDEGEAPKTEEPVMSGSAELAEKLSGHDASSRASGHGGNAAPDLAEDTTAIQATIQEIEDLSGKDDR